MRGLTTLHPQRLRAGVKMSINWTDAWCIGEANEKVENEFDTKVAVWFDEAASTNANSLADYKKNAMEYLEDKILAMREIIEWIDENFPDNEDAELPESMLEAPKK
jgi:hypothetical protein